MPIDFNAIAQQCAPAVHPTTLQAVVRTESGFNPYAIGVVGGRLVRQPTSRDEAVATARALEAQGWNFSMGLGQVNRTNLARYGLDLESAFDPCANLRAGAAILSDCYTRASARMGSGQQALRGAFSCYYSGNFRTGFKADAGHSSYVQRVVANTPVRVASVGPARVMADAAALRMPPAGARAVAATPIAVAPATDRFANDLRMPVSRRAGRGAPSGSAGDDAFSPRPRAAWDTFGDF